MVKLIVSLILFINTLYAYNVFKPIGFKATGMGGVGTANSTGTMASYYNPALLLATPQKSEFVLGVGITYRENNVAENLDSLANADFDTLFENIANNAENGNKEITLLGVTTSIDGVDNSAEDIAGLKSIQDIFSNLSSKNALYLAVTPYLSGQITNNFAIGLFTYVDAVVKINAEKGYTEFIFEDSTNGYYLKYDPDTDIYSNVTKSEYETSSIEYAINNGLLSVEAKGIILIELPITFADVSNYANGYFAYGANIKYMSMNMIDKTISLGGGSDEIENIAQDSADNDFDDNLGIDVGIAYQPKNSGTILGLMVKNANSPTFEIGTEKVKIDKAIRFGVSQQMLGDTLELAMDIDLTKNDSLIDGDQNRYIGLGLEFHPASWFSIRTGVMRDLETEYYDEGNVYTVGLGAGLKWGQLDISAMMSQKDGYYDGDAIPRYMKVNVSFVSKWGSR